MFEILLRSLIVLPQRHLKELTATKEVSERDLKIALKLRCALDIKRKDSPLTWLNDFITATTSITSYVTSSPTVRPSISHKSMHYRLHDFAIDCIADLLRHRRSSQEASVWMLELMRQIQSVVVADVRKVFADTYSLRVLVMAIVVLSGRDVFVLPGLHEQSSYLELFPQSVAFLVQTYPWTDCTPQVKTAAIHTKTHFREKCGYVMLDAY